MSERQRNAKRGRGENQEPSLSSSDAARAMDRFHDVIRLFTLSKPFPAATFWP
jgi:hypothetical protein